MKKTIQSNYRVVIKPKRLGDLGFAHVPENWFGNEEQRNKEYYNLCNEISEELNREIGRNVHSFVESDKIDVCVFCGSPWTEESNEYNGGCCDQDEAENPINKYSQLQCGECGDTGRSYPTLENPDGVACECVINKVK